HVTGVQTCALPIYAAANTIHISLQICASLAVLLDPIVPFSAARPRRVLRLEAVRPSGAGGGSGWSGGGEAGRPLLEAGHKLGPAEILFSKIDDEIIDAQLLRLRKREASADLAEEKPERPYAEPKATIAYDDFAKLDLRAGFVKNAERVDKSDKLLRLEV